MRVHPECEPSCTHTLVPDRGGKIVQCPGEQDRSEREAKLAELFPGKRIEYLGLSYEHERHTWRVGAKLWRPMRRTDAPEGRQAKREIKYEYRPAVWTGTGLPVPPVDFSRVPEVIEQPYPEPSLTSDMPCDLPSSRPAADLLMLAIAHGWQGRITHAEGHAPHATHGRPSAKAKKSEAVRLSRGDQRAGAVRVDGSWSSLWTWSATEFFTRHKLLDEFRGALT